MGALDVMQLIGDQWLLSIGDKHMFKEKRS
jgi:hypothetical protein